MHSLGKFLKTHHIHYTEQCLYKLESFMHIFLHWNKTHSLSSIKDTQNFITYCQDSIYPLCFIEPFECAIDVGSGAGFPALALAAIKEHARFFLVEPNKKKAAFLKVASLEMGLNNIYIYNQKIQDMQYLKVELLTSRALCSMEQLIAYARNINYSAILLYKGTNTVQEAHCSYRKHTLGKMHYIYKHKEHL